MAVKTLPSQKPVQTPPLLLILGVKAANLVVVFGYPRGVNCDHHVYCCVGRCLSECTTLPLPAIASWCVAVGVLKIFNAIKVS